MRLSDIRRAAAALPILAAAGCAQAAAPPPVAGVPQALVVEVGTAAPTDQCVLIAAGEPTRRVRLKQVFLEPFDKLDLKSGRWQPHFDGGYDWPTKRTLTPNEEQQFYVDPGYRGTASRPLGLNPFRVERGILSITADRASDTAAPFLYGYRYTSGLLTTRNSLLMRYGYYEVRARVPVGKGLWPGFWLLPDTRREGVPEFDAIETRGSDPHAVNQTTHWTPLAGGSGVSGCRSRVNDTDTAFHTYGVLLLPDRTTYYIDRRPTGTIATPPGVAEKQFYMLVNLAVGGRYDGPIAPDTRLPAVFAVDHIAAYALADADDPSGQARDR